MFTKLLIANRGEIACRIARTAHRMGISTVAVFSEVDANAGHVEQCDEAVCIGAGPAKSSYLNIGKIIDAARRTGADAIHPGYGFLSENDSFAQSCLEAGFTFIGPSPDAIRRMGSKASAKSLVEEVGVPLIPGYHGVSQDNDILLGEACKIGFPVIVKAVAGGGGKGMRIVYDPAQFLDTLASCRREGLAGFGNDTVLIEKYLEKGRHVEVQVFADMHGTTLHLFDRDCSVQRRHQKIIEEAPAPGLAQDTRDRMGSAAIRIANAIGYVGAGTVEFMVSEDGAFYFMEMNTRLQVEHPVTEMITKLDLVELQLRVAAGERLSFAQNDLICNGHSIEVRICAENPEVDFVPSAGRIIHLDLPPDSEGIRMDSGIRVNDVVTAHYDSMLAKLIVWGQTRELAIARMHRALCGCRIVGPETNVSFLARLVLSDSFMRQDLGASLIEREANRVLTKNAIPPQAFVIAAIGLCTTQRDEPSDGVPGRWADGSGWLLNGPPTRYFRFIADNAQETVIVESLGSGYVVAVAGRKFRCDSYFREKAEVVVRMDGHQFTIHWFRDGPMQHIFWDDACYRFRLRDLDIGNADIDPVGMQVLSPMPGSIVAAFVGAGDCVKKGDVLFIVEAMKMEYRIQAHADGTVARVLGKVGDQVSLGERLVEWQVQG